MVKSKVICVLLMVAMNFGCVSNMNKISNTEHEKGIFERVTGTWGWKDNEDLNCINRPAEFVFGPNDKTFRIQGEKPRLMHDGTTREYVDYEIVSSSDNSITMKMENETRKNKKGELTLWKLVLVSDNQFFWEKTGEPDHQWGPIIRCN